MYNTNQVPSADFLCPGIKIKTKTEQHGWSDEMILMRVANIVQHENEDIVFYNYMDSDGKYHGAISTLSEMYMVMVTN